MRESMERVEKRLD